jgi:quercetin dioxygenase-like cupin family protein
LGREGLNVPSLYGSQMKPVIIATVAFLAGATLATIGLQLTTAHAQTQGRVASQKQIFKTDLSVCDGKEVIITRIDATPGQNSWHYHPGDSFTYVIEGSQVRETDEGKAQFDPGMVFYDKPQQIHRSENSAPVKLLVVRVIEKGLRESIPIR